ncbi:MAG: 3-isopropylmalate dehydratase small subunit [Taibaiella sp.]|jgi:3-isopropylmalate/(R)-2-methylmalate dehydratase small subunit
MDIFKTLTGRAIPLDMDNVDTDMIIPAQFLTKINRNGYGEHVFARLREQDKNFVFNDPHYQSLEILLTKANFGCGSSREHAVWALKQAGIKVVIAPSYSDIFYNNSANNGLLTIILPEVNINTLIEQTLKEDIEITVDLQQQIITTKNANYSFDYDPFRKTCLLNGQDDFDYLLEATRG